MVDYVVPAVAAPSLAVLGDTRRFPLRRVFCIGRNYHWPAHGAQSGRETPVFFMKPADSVVPASGAIAYPPLTRDFCHEIELVVAIGSDASQVAPQDAQDHIWGYAAGLDLTRRDLQASAKQNGQPWEGAKAFDAAAPTSALVPVASCGHPTRGAIWLSVNGVERQRADLADLLWSVPELISFLSHSVQLKAGDLVFTGTPAGVGALQRGDVVSGGIDGIQQFSLAIA